MKKMIIYEPAMCCPTGLCGVGVNPELLRISTVLANLEKNGIKIERYNLTNAPQEFIKNAEVNQIMAGFKDVPCMLLCSTTDERQARPAGQFRPRPDGTGPV